VSSPSRTACRRTIRIAPAEVEFRPNVRITPRQLLDAFTASIN